MNKIPRGLRNKNPGNIDYNPANDWHGQIGIETGVSNPRFAVFSGYKWGVRAIGKLLLTYARKHKINNCLGVASRWAPSHENNTLGYAAHLAYGLDVSISEPIDIENPKTLATLINRIIIMEIGTPAFLQIPKADLDEGVSLALVGVK